MKKIYLLITLMSLACGTALANVQRGQTELNILYGNGETDIGPKFGQLVVASKPDAGGLQIMHNLFPMLALGLEGDHAKGNEGTKMKLDSACVMARITLIPGWIIHPYVLGGAGYGRFRVLQGTGNNVGAAANEKYSGLVTVMGGGLSLDLGRNLVIGAEFHERIMRRKDSVFYDVRGAGTRSLSGKTCIDESTFLARLGFKFGGKK